MNENFTQNHNLLTLKITEGNTQYLDNIKTHILA